MGSWKESVLADAVPAPAARALGGLQPGMWIIEPDEVRIIADDLAELNFKDCPKPGLVHWHEDLDLEGDLDELCCDCLQEIYQYYQVAAKTGWGMHILT